MSTASNKDFVRQINQALNAPDWEAQISKFPMVGFSQEEKEQWLMEHRAFRKAFPDFHAEILDLIAEGDRVVVIQNVTGTHRSEFPYYELKGIRATDLKLEWLEIQVYDFSGGRMTLPYFMLDGVGRLKQLGVLP